MLRASIEHSGGGGSVRGVAEGAKAGDLGIEHGGRLTAFVDAAVQGDAAALDSARDALRDAAGSGVVVDAAAVIGNFERMVRIADGAGIPLDGVVSALSGDIRGELGIDQFESRRQTRSSGLERLVGYLLRPVMKAALRFKGRRAQKKKS